jgi:large repetitive protein
VDKVYESTRVAGTPVTYTVTATNVGTAAGTNVLLADTVPAGVTYGGSDGTLVGGSVNWTFDNIAEGGGSSSGRFWGTLACAGTVTNDDYQVVSSDQGVGSPGGGPVSFTIVAPTLSPSFEQSASQANVGETLGFDDTSTTNGAAIVAWSWDFGDGHTASGTSVSHAYDAPGTYDVTLTITDACDYTESTTVVDAVTVGQYHLFLPTVVKD